ncbi:MAG: 50S ribosomal protein L37Ae [Candidatus Hydrothermarchaeales archaeon]
MGKKVGSAGKFGPRYGMRLRKKWLAADKRHRALYECPVCNRQSVKRVASGIWSCSKCGVKFTGGAYSPVTGAAKTMERAIKHLAEERE